MSLAKTASFAGRSLRSTSAARPAVRRRPASAPGGRREPGRQHPHACSCLTTPIAPPRRPPAAPWWWLLPTASSGEGLGSRRRPARGPAACSPSAVQLASLRTVAAAVKTLQCLTSADTCLAAGSPATRRWCLTTWTAAWSAVRQAAAAGPGGERAAALQHGSSSLAHGWQRATHCAAAAWLWNACSSNPHDAALAGLPQMQQPPTLPPCNVLLIRCRRSPAAVAPVVQTTASTPWAWAPPPSSCPGTCTPRSSTAAWP